MRWCAEDLGLSLRWHNIAIVYMPQAAPLPSLAAALPGNDACGIQHVSLRSYPPGGFTVYC